MRIWKFVLCSVLTVLYVCTESIPLLALQPSEMAVQQESHPVAVAGELLVQYRSSSDASERSAVRSSHGLKKKESFPLVESELVSITNGKTADAAIRSLQDDPQVLSAQPNFYYYATINDPAYSDEWGLNNNGQNVNGSIGTADVDVDAPEAWAYTLGSADVVVAIIDSGIDIEHPDLAANIWENPGEIAGDGIDNDANGYVDDINGWNFVNGTRILYSAADGDEHGTHCAGIIAAVSDNGIGISGVAPNVRIMPLKAFGPDGGTTADAIQAIEYARLMGADIINASWGNTAYDSLLRQMIIDFGRPFIAAAGNNNQNSDITPFYPASFDCANIISVAAIDSRGALADFSNYSSTRVDIGAPGVSILSTFPGSRYVYGDGTSMAAPFITAIAALAVSANSLMTTSEVRQAVLGSAVELASLSGKTVTGGMGNAKGAVLAALSLNPDLVPPEITGTNPADGAIQVDNNQSITIQFSEAIRNNADISGVSLYQGAAPIEINRLVINNTLKITSVTPLSYHTAYTVNIPASAITDIAGNHLAASYSFTFNTDGKYVVTYNLQGGTAIVSSVAVAEDSLISIPPAPTRIGYSFVGWFKEPACITAWDFSNDRVTADTTLYASWTKTALGQFVNRFYQKCFNRDADAGGYNYWVTKLQLRELSGAELSDQFVFSQEFMNMNLSDSDYITVMYNAFFNRDPDAGGQMFWMSQFDNGMSRYFVLAGFVNSQEFQNLAASYGINSGSLALTAPVDKYPQITSFVTRFYKLCLNRMPDAAGLAHWVVQLQTQNLSGANVAHDIVTSAEFTNRGTTNDEFVEIMYKAFFDRTSEASGKAYWSGRLAAGTSRYTVLAGFVNSQEFTDICQLYAINKGTLS